MDCECFSTMNLKIKCANRNNFFLYKCWFFFPTTFSRKRWFFGIFPAMPGGFFFVKFCVWLFLWKNYKEILLRGTQLGPQLYFLSIPLYLIQARNCFPPGFLYFSIKHCRISFHFRQLPVPVVIIKSAAKYKMAGQRYYHASLAQTPMIHTCGKLIPFI